ncbi:MAG: glycosyltransferase family 39 protein [Alphaproteobacteria bacterium]|nr:glycosyltransferase family 39 protein [Alphaproteobacteria bacterium]
MEQSDIKHNYLSLFVELLVVTFVGLVLTLIYNDTIILDELEHLRAAYFVSLGEVPYRDFFEHHHPLIWYMFAPIISVIPHLNLVALYTAKSLAFTVSVGSSIIIYLIAKRFMGGVFAGVMTLLLFFFYFASWYSFSIFKPDTFMRFFYLLGLYNFLLYYDRQKLKNLILSGTFFAVAFLFLQTAAFSILPLCIPAGYLLYKQPHLWADYAKALTAPLIIIATFYTLLYVSGTLPNYWQLNFTYNKYLFGIVHPFTPSVLPDFLILIVIAYAAVIYVYATHKQTPYFNIFAILLAGETVNHLYFPAVYPHYLVLLFLFCGFIISFVLNFEQSKWIFRITFVVLIINLVLNIFSLAATNNKESHLYLREYDKNPEASIVNFDVTLFSIFAPKYSYYWFYPNFEYIDNSLFHRMPDYNINQIIREHKPLYIAYNPRVKQAFDFKKAGQKFDIAECYPQHSLNTEILQNYDEILINLYKRKPLD